MALRALAGRLALAPDIYGCSPLGAVINPPGYRYLGVLRDYTCLPPLFQVSRFYLRVKSSSAIGHRLWHRHGVCRMV